ncbi:efflux RND transporter permease subunit [Maledivibacter halophilus]|uniref:Multidrug efflux pump subunit AcrB n=1 Tax=Maledivibacter halophilus TaxID=36842 RepID=A0A1T5JSD8_9FIRM|nr:efflux RND transporter permease subunit [Maledivibacter halophilus]SKC54138.1 Multidrug efflux pump subunit AcrB [Maledivibacter halophilus]
MKRFVNIAIRDRKITLFVAFLLVIIGLFNYHMAPKQQSPKIELATAMITTVYSGASAEDVEEMVSKKIEEELMTFEEYDEVASYSRPSVSVILFTVKVADDYSKTWDKVRRRMEDLQRELPEGCGRIEVDTDFMATAGIILSLSGNNYSYSEIEKYGDDIKWELSRIHGINKIEIEGKHQEEILIELDYRKMNYLGVSYDEVLSLIKVQNLEIPSGQVFDGHSKINFRAKGFYDDLSDIENIVVAVSEETGIVTRIKDIGVVKLALEDSAYKVKTNLNNSILIVGYFEDGKNIIPIGKEIDNALEKLKHQIPNDIVIGKVLYQPEIVEREVSGFITSLLQGIIFVIIVVFIGMGLRNAIIVSIAIPLSIFMTFSGMRLFEVEIHQISIVALIISLGMLVDNAIVVSDAIQVRLDKGEDRIKACVDGVIEVAVPILTSTATTICTFMPLLLMGGEIGEYLKSLPIIVILALSSSYLVALFLTPTMAFLFFKKSRPKRKKLIFIDKILKYSIDRKSLVLLLLVIIIIGTVKLGGSMGLKFFPFADTDMMYIDVRSELSSDIEKTEELTDEIVKIVIGYDEITDCVAAIGDGLPRFYDTMFPAFPSKDYGQIVVKLDKGLIGKGRKYSNLTALRDDIQRKLNEKISSGTAVVKQLEQGEPIGTPVNIRIVGKDVEGLGEVAKEIKAVLKTIKGTSNVDTDFVSKQYEYISNVDKIKASHMGINNYNIQNEINIALRGRNAGILRMNGEEYDIRLKSNISKVSELKNLAIKSKITDKKHILKDMGKIELASVLPVIKKIDNEYSVNVFSDVLSGSNAVKIQEELMDKVDKSKYSDVRFVLGGESKSIERNFSKIGFIGLAFLLVVYGILLLQFKSFIEPFIILLTVPLSVIGSFLGLYTTGTNLSFTALLGMVSLAGIVVNNAIILIDYINSEIKEGRSKKDACIEAAKKRSRPILLSTTTTVIGLIPLILMGSELFTPMAISLMSGLLVSTLLTLIVIPVIASIVIKEGKIEEKI